MSNRVARYNARRVLERALHSKALARAVTKEIYIRNNKNHITFMNETRALVKLLKVVTVDKLDKRSVNGVLGLADKLKRERFAATRKFVITTSKAQQVQQAKAMETGRTGKSGFVAH